MWIPDSGKNVTAKYFESHNDKKGINYGIRSISQIMLALLNAIMIHMIRYMCLYKNTRYIQ